MSYSPTENAILICSDVDGGSYELYIVPKDNLGRGDGVLDAKRGLGGSAIFVARNRFAVLDKSNNQVLVKNLKNEIVKKSALPLATDAIFYAATGNLLCRSEDRVVIFDLQQRLVLGDLQTPSVKYVVWSNDLDTVALLSKHAIVIASKNLCTCTLHETIRVKSGAWDVSGNIIHCLDRDGKNRAIAIAPTDLIAYLQQKGFPEVALHFVKDEKTRFNLALESGNIQVAVASAKRLMRKTTGIGWA
ncbi:hypothetical protein C5167_010210 [Papaver somniferum]|uniref:COPA/B second beta-propeller domain-containing protein n=1 Tax=Papaver somniferum TaxID=3469 RepID=A0A4Y7K3J4_PAPSO|nr:hypothetical protein C5167_010210 [Papaver somniferum]